MREKIEQLIKWAEVRRSAFSAFTKVFQTPEAKFKSVGRLEETDFFICQLKKILSELPLTENEPSHSDECACSGCMLKRAFN